MAADRSAGFFHISVRGGDEWDNAVRGLRHADKAIRQELDKAIKSGAKPIVDAQKQAILSWRSSGSGGGGGGGRAGRAQVHADRAASYAAGRSRATKTLAKGGFGLRATIAKSIEAKVKFRGPSRGVRIQVNPKALGNRGARLPERINDGKWRHPVYGNRDAWASQTGKPGWFTKTAADGLPEFTIKVAQAVDTAAKRIEKGAV